MIDLEMVQSASMFEDLKFRCHGEPRGGRNGGETARRASPSWKHPNHRHEKPRPVRRKHSDSAVAVSDRHYYQDRNCGPKPQAAGGATISRCREAFPQPPGYSLATHHHSIAHFTSSKRRVCPSLNNCPTTKSQAITSTLKAPHIRPKNIFFFKTLPKQRINEKRSLQLKIIAGALGNGQGPSGANEPLFSAMQQASPAPYR